MGRGRGIRIYPDHLSKIRSIIQEHKYAVAPKCPKCGRELIPKIVPAPFTKEFQNLKFFCSNCKTWRQTQDFVLLSLLNQLGLGT